MEKKSSRFENVLNVQLREKHLKTLSRVHLLATFHTLQRQQQRHSLCNTQQRSHNHKRVLYKWEQQMVWHFWGVVEDTLSQQFQSHSGTIVQWECHPSYLFGKCFHHIWHIYLTPTANVRNKHTKLYCMWKYANLIIFIPLWPHCQTVGQSSHLVPAKTVRWILYGLSGSPEDNDPLTFPQQNKGPTPPFCVSTGSGRVSRFLLG